MVLLAQQLTLLVPALLLALPLGMATLGVASAQSPSASAAALALRSATPAAERRRLDLPFTEAARSDWHYIPRSRNGIAWKEMSAMQREATLRLLRSALSDAGVVKVQAVMALEIALRELETSSRRDPENYSLALFGDPSAQKDTGSGSGKDSAAPPANAAPPAQTEPWGWRIEGHHLSLHFTLLGDRYLSTLPQFMGANPAVVPRDIAQGPPRGTRVLGQEEDLARQLLEALGPAQHATCLFDRRTYGDIVTKNAAKLSPLSPVGVPWAELPAAQQALLLKLITVFAEHLRPELIEQRLARVRTGGMGSIRFGWAGSVTRGEPFYFRIQGAGFLIELDNSGGNHIHSVWRDFNGDWGHDTLAEHYRGSAAGGHSHGSH
ncbi:MAG: hypothetical protein RL033_4350 [Pseudomonadota bacterium]